MALEKREVILRSVDSSYIRLLSAYQSSHNSSQNKWNILTEFPVGSTFTSTVTMPRMSGRAQVLQDTDPEVEAIAYAYLCIGILIRRRGGIWRGSWGPPWCTSGYNRLISNRYLLPRSSVEKHDINILEIYIQKYSDTTFLNLFRMHRASFWQVVEILASVSRKDY